MNGLPFRDYLSEYSDDLIFRTQQHLLLSLYCVALAAAVGLTLALLTYNRSWWANLNIGIVAILFTVPSVALFGFLISVMGQPLLTIIIAVSMYSLLPIVRNAVVGLQTADPNVIDVSQGHGGGPVPHDVADPPPDRLADHPGGSARQRPSSPSGWRRSPRSSATTAWASTATTTLDNLVWPVNTKNEAIVCVLFVALVALFFDACFVLVRRFTTPRGTRRA